jgi:3-hydroxyacyl-CoA dehydrogenase/enoyl-CoA hydratase/3-hydroxybutyryl-CoA epimerase
MSGRVLAALEDRELELGPAQSAAASLWTHWRMAVDDAGVAWLVIDKQSASTNTIDEEILREFDSALSEVEAEKPKGLAIRSAKAGGFMVGADVGMFRGMTDLSQAKEAIRQANEVVDRLDALPVTTVAVVHGHCVGGGLEIALACDLRIAIAGASLGFPEVLLGLHPGLGGTARSTHLIDPIEAMTMMLTGRSIDVRRAKYLGLVDAVTEERHVRNAVRAAATGALRPKRRSLKTIGLNMRPARGFAARRMREKAAEKAPPQHYPAPYALVDLWEHHGGSRREMKQAEHESFARLLVGDTAQNLLRVFGLRSTLKEAGKSDPKIDHIHVVGAGEMGGEIAAWCAAQGFGVTLSDLDAKALAKAVGRASDLFDKILKDSASVRDALDRLTPDLRNSGVQRADLIIEAVPEKADLKRRVYSEIEPRMKPDAILATNTSSIRLENLCESLKQPDRFVGLHFFNPVSRMQLVEVVRHPGADARSIAKAMGFVGRLDKLPVLVKSAPGFLVNRVLAPYLVEAIALVDEGMPKETVDKSAKDFGMPMGPIELADQVGLDICVEVAGMLRSELDRPMPDLPSWLTEKVEKGQVGRKSGKGLYDWKDGKPVKARDVPAPEAETADRLILPMLNACVSCLRENIVDDADMLDGAMIFGTGFAPFRGGPLRYARNRGVDQVVMALRTLENRLGARFAPDEGWTALRDGVRHDVEAEAE